MLNVNVRHIHTSSFQVCFHSCLCCPAISWKVEIFASMPNFVDTVQTADRQFVCVCCDEYDRAQTHSPTGKKKRPVNCNESFPIGWDSHFQENFCHYWRVCEPFVEALSDKLWQEGSRLQLVTEVSQTSSLSVTTAPSPPSLFFFAVSHPSHLPNRDKHFPNEGVGWESCGEWSVDVTSGVVGHLLFMGRGPCLWKCVCLY